MLVFFINYILINPDPIYSLIKTNGTILFNDAILYNLIINKISFYPICFFRIL